MLPRHRSGPRCEEDAGLTCRGIALGLPSPHGRAAGVSEAPRASTTDLVKNNSPGWGNQLARAHRLRLDIHCLRCGMPVALSTKELQPWRKRLHIPAYQVGEAAKYARVSAQTVVAWHKIDQRLLSEKRRKERLSYLQLIELAVVAALRKAKFSLVEIRAAREYVKQHLKSDYPFAEYEFKRYGKSLFTEYQELSGARRLVKANQAGQLAWMEIIGPVLEEFEYEHKGVAIRWHLAGASSPIIIDPRISFGAPSVKGTPTWIIKGRYDAGETDSEIAEDFNLDVPAVREALRFEGVTGQSPKWTH
jgi:uncharacterized protein (DUF433 family)/DNA-binding transcriptional MerR regulator